MTFAAEYPEQRYIVPDVTIRRECFLPDEITGMVMATTGQRVDGGTIVARGQAPSPHHIIQAATLLNLRKKDVLGELLEVEIGDTVEEDTVLARKGRRRVESPIAGIVVGIDEARIIVKETPRVVEVPAGMQGYVVAVREGRGVIVETSGAILQGVWGNGRRAVGTLRAEPDMGIEFIHGDDLAVNWRGTIVVSRRSLTASSLAVIHEQEIAGVIAPSMDSILLNSALLSERAILLTEGFGNENMSVTAQNFFDTILANQPNSQTIIDAIVPSVLESRRPEVLITLSTRNAQEFRTLQPASKIKLGMRVRITRAPHNGQTGTVVDIPATPLILSNTLRVAVAQIQLGGGDIIPIPIANLELFAG